MSITTTATILVRLNNGATQSGGITASPGDVVQLVAASYAGWGSPAPRWEILTYPSTWATPSGWTKDTASGAIYFLGTNPPPFTLPSSGDVLNGMFGVWRLALTVNEGDRPDLVDKNRTAIEIISANGVRDVAFGERFEYDSKFSHATKFEANNRKLDEAVGGMVSLGPTVPAVVSATTGSAGASSTASRSDHSHQLTESVLRTVATGLTAPLAVNSQRITNMALPQSPADAAPKLYVDALPFKLSVRGASLANRSLSGALTEDGITYQTGDLYLAKNQTSTAQNGIYVVNTGGAWARHGMFSLDAHVANGAIVGVREGSTYAGTGWSLTTAAPITLDTTGLVFGQIWGPVFGTVTNVSGTLPIVVANGASMPAISINAATSGAAGSMSAADKATMESATASAVNNTLVKRDNAASAAFNYVTAAIVQSNANLGLAADGFQTMVLDGQGTGLLLVPSGIRTAAVQFDAQQDLTRSIPLNWSACKVGGVASWSINDTSDLVNDVVDPFANLTIECYFPNGCKITKVHIWNKGPGGGGNPLPANPPSFYLYRKPLATGIPALLATVNATLDGTYRGTRRKITLDISGAPHTVDAAANRYYIVVTPEFGTDALVGGLVQGAEVERNFPANYAIGLE